MREMEDRVQSLHVTTRAVTGSSRFKIGPTGFQTGRQESQSSTLSEVFEASQPGSHGNPVYFLMDDVVNEVGGVESITVETVDLGSSSRGEDPDNHPATELQNNAGSIVTSSLSASHPHSLPLLHRPRLLLCGGPGGGQSSHLGPALLHILEEIPVKVLDLSVTFGVTSCSPEESLVQLFKEAKRVSPSIIYLPRVDSWWDVTTETFQVTFTSSLLSLPPSTSLVVIATAECPWSTLSPSLQNLFSFVSKIDILFFISLFLSLSSLARLSLFLLL